MNIEECNKARLEWVRLDGAARKLEELRKVVKAEIANQARNEGLSATAAEQVAEADPRYRKHVESMVDARTQANIKKAEVDGMEMRWETWRSMNATKRAEMKLY